MVCKTWQLVGYALGDDWRNIRNYLNLNLDLYPFAVSDVELAAFVSGALTDMNVINCSYVFTGVRAGWWLEA